MKKIKYYCDHCGKELDIITDYFDIEISFGPLVCEKHVDLCNNCFIDVNNIISKFCSETVKKEK